MGAVNIKKNVKFPHLQPIKEEIIEQESSEKFSTKAVNIKKNVKFPHLQPIKEENIEFETENSMLVNRLLDLQRRQNAYQNFSGSSPKAQERIRMIQNRKNVVSTNWNCPMYFNSFF